MTYPHTPDDLSAGDRIEYWDPAQPAHLDEARIETGEILWVEGGLNPYCVCVDVDGWARQMIRPTDVKQVVQRAATQEEMF